MCHFIPKLNIIKTNATIVTIGDIDLYFSYETCVAVKSYKRDIAVQTDKKYSRTTTKHIKEMGAGNFKVIEHETFEKFLDELFRD